MPNAESNFSWDKTTVCITQDILAKIFKHAKNRADRKGEFPKNPAALDKRLAAAKTESEEATAMAALKPFGETLSNIISCFNGRVYQNEFDPNIFVVGDAICLKLRLGLDPFEYVIEDLFAKSHEATRPCVGFPKITYKDKLPELVKAFMDGFFSTESKELEAAISKEWRTIAQMQEKIKFPHYFLFGYLLRRALFEKTVKYSENDINVLWSKV